MGVPGAALATLAAVISAVTYLVLLRRKGIDPLVQNHQTAVVGSLEPLVKGVWHLLRNLALNLTAWLRSHNRLIKWSRRRGSRHSGQPFKLEGIVLLALSTVAQTMFQCHGKTIR
jgi:hypothetical protein